MILMRGSRLESRPRQRGRGFQDWGGGGLVTLAVTPRDCGQVRVVATISLRLREWYE